MKRIPVILGTILAICILALVVIDISTPLTSDERACIDAGFPVEPLSVKDCAEMLQLERDVHRLRKDLNEIKKQVNPGIDI